jgi:hypothetical protein
MTEAQIERNVERMVDRLDHAYMATNMPEYVYKAEMERIDAWAKAQLRFSRREAV